MAHRDRTGVRLPNLTRTVCQQCPARSLDLAPPRAAPPRLAPRLRGIPTRASRASLLAAPPVLGVPRARSLIGYGGITGAPCPAWPQHQHGRVPCAKLATGRTAASASRRTADARPQQRHTCPPPPQAQQAARRAEGSAAASRPLALALDRPLRLPRAGPVVTVVSRRTSPAARNASAARPRVRTQPGARGLLAV